MTGSIFNEVMMSEVTTYYDKGLAKNTKDIPPCRRAEISPVKVKDTPHELKSACGRDFWVESEL